MRLIDVDNVISVAEGEFSEEDVSKIRWLLSHIGTAYDIDKVVEELEKLKGEKEMGTSKVVVKECIEIVKQGVRYICDYL